MFLFRNVFFLILCSSSLLFVNSRNAITLLFSLSLSVYLCGKSGRRDITFCLFVRIERRFPTRPPSNPAVFLPLKCLYMENLHELLLAGSPVSKRFLHSPTLSSLCLPRYFPLVAPRSISLSSYIYVCTR